MNSLNLFRIPVVNLSIKQCPKYKSTNSKDLKDIKIKMKTPIGNVKLFN